MRRTVVHITRISRGSEIPAQAQRVFLVCTGCKIEDRDAIISDLLSFDAGIDCVVSYVENNKCNIDKDVLRAELNDTHMLVILITVEMLQSLVAGEWPSSEYRIAQKEHIPILPILRDEGLFSLYKDKIGPIHCIDMADSEYRVKLKAQLESDDIHRRIQEKAFTSAVFVSYRKHELREARRFMKAFHDLEGFESISVLYDNFLRAGKDFNNGIKESITISSALVLVVTPDLATKGNYVQTIEYPFAKSIEKPVISVESIPTSQILFSELFPEAEHPVSLDNAIVLQEVFRNKLGEDAFPVQLDSERIYLLGMAYLKGVGVERDFDRALRLLEVATEICTTISIDAAIQLASIYKNGMTTNVDYEKALYWSQKAAFHCEQLEGYQHPLTADIYNDIALVYSEQGNYLEALKWHQKVLGIRERVLGKDSLEIANTYHNIAFAYNRMGDYPKAYESYQKALYIREKVLSKDHPETATTYHNIAFLLYSQGDYPNALSWYHKALNIREKFLGNQHPSTAATYNNIALVYEIQDNYSDALMWYQKALDICEKVFGKEHPYTAAVYNDIAGVYDCQDNYPKALEWYQKALVIKEKILGTTHPSTATTYNNIAGIYKNKRDYIKALKWYHKALSIKEQSLGMEHPSTATTYNGIAEVHVLKGDYKKALEWYHKARYIRDKLLGKKHPDTVATHNSIAEIHSRQRTMKNRRM
jgi:tetratricopeptide (TPR) repeat protein